LSGEEFFRIILPRFARTAMSDRNRDDDKSETTAAAKKLGRRGGLKGGKARAAVLTPEQRSEIARRAVEARWAKARSEGAVVKSSIPRATHGSEDHPIRIFDIEISCYVLSDKTRVITNRGLQKSLGMAESGGAQRLATLMERFGSKNIDVKDLPARILRPIEFRPQRGGRSAYGYEATVLADLCDAILEARIAGVLKTKHELRLAEHAELLVRGFARVGIIALVDEATGYQEVRAKDELRQIMDKIIEAYVLPERTRYDSKFKEEFFKQVYRLHGWPYKPGNAQRTPLLGKIINKYIYGVFPKCIPDEIRIRNPKRENGRRRDKNYYWLTEEPGIRQLEQQIETVTRFMKAAEDKEQFERAFERAYASEFQERLALTYDAIPDEDPARGEQ
jgi:hypothetical protein